MCVIWTADPDALQKPGFEGGERGGPGLNRNADQEGKKSSCVASHAAETVILYRNDLTGSFLTAAADTKLDRTSNFGPNHRLNPGEKMRSHRR